MATKTLNIVILVGIIVCVIGVCVGLFFAYNALSRYQKLLAVAAKKCHEYAKLACKTETPDRQITPEITNSHESEKIRGGEEVRENQFPHLALLSISGEICSGSLISEKFILTVSSCLQNVKKDQVAVKLGSVFRTKNETGKWFQVDEIITHPDYEKGPNGLHFNDIALLKLTQTVNFDETMRPICLGVYVGLKKPYVDQGPGLVAGWGLDESGNLSEPLRVLDDYMSDGIRSDCEAKWGDRFGYYDTMICAGRLQTNIGLCKGDYGGPFQVPDTNVNMECHVPFYELLGLASASSHECTPNAINETLVVAYTRVERFIPWIVEKVWYD